MDRNVLKRYMVFLAVLIVCAGVAWYVSNASKSPQGNVVLAAEEEKRDIMVQFVQGACETAVPSLNQEKESAVSSAGEGKGGTENRTGGAQSTAGKRADMQGGEADG